MKTIVAALAIGLAPLLSLADKEPNISHLPQSVQDRIKEWKGEGEVKKVKTRKSAEGTVYEVEYKDRGDEKEMVIAPDGTVLSESEGKGKGHKKDKKPKKKKDKDKPKDKWKDDGDDERDEVDDRSREIPTGERGRISKPREEVTPAPKQLPPRSTRVSAEAPRFIAWEQLPPKVQYAVTEQRDLGSARQIQAQTRKGKILYHVTYEKGIISYSPEGEVVDSNTYWK